MIAYPIQSTLRLHLVDLAVFCQLLYSLIGESRPTFPSQLAIYMFDVN